MTRIITINCSKWKKVIGLTLWSGATIGLGVGLYCMINWFLIHGFGACNLSGVKNWCDSSLAVVMIILLAFALTSNFFNTLAIWMTINDHWKILEVKCNDGDQKC